jgi:hypothetical protein
MHRFPFGWLWPAACAVAGSATLAQVPPRVTTVPDPLDAKAPVPALVYRSSLSSYRRLAEDAPLPWRQANETVGRIGGWRAYAREASAAAASPSEALAPTVPLAASAPHATTPAPSASAPAATLSPGDTGPTGHHKH